LSKYQVENVELKRNRTPAVADRLGAPAKEKFLVLPAVVATKPPSKTQLPPPTEYSTVPVLLLPLLLAST